MESNRYSPDNVLLHDPSSRRRNKLYLTSPSGLDVVSEVVAVVEAVVAVGVVHRGHIATSVPVSAALGCLQLVAGPSGGTLVNCSNSFSMSDISGVGARTLYGRNYPPE